MLKKLFTAVVLLSITAPAFAYKVTTFQPLQPAFQSNLGGNENYPKITQVEQILFKRSYSGQNIYTRLSRIEERMFRQKFANMPLSARVDNILSNIDQGEMYGIASRDLSKLETKVLGRTFSGEDTDSRITRLEKEMLGAMQNGNLKQRYEVIKQASKHYNAFPQQYARNSAFTPNNYYRPQRQSIVTKLLDAAAGGFGLANMAGGMGTMTGYTPPLYDPYNQYSGGYYPGNGAGQEDYYMGNTGGRYLNRNIGSGAGVRILN